MAVYGFKDKSTAERASRNNRSNPNSTEVSDFKNYILPSRVRVVELTKDIDGAGDPEEEGAYEPTDVDIVRTSTDPPERLETNGGFITQIEAAPLESTNLPEDERVLAITDTFNQTFLMTLNPSEVFGTIDEDWTNDDMESSVSITLDDGFTVHGESTLEAYPSPTLPEYLDAYTPVTCRYVKSKGEWFFFRPSGEELPEVTVNGNQLLGLGQYRGHLIFDSSIDRGFYISGTFQVVRKKKVRSSFGNNWYSTAIFHPNDIGDRISQAGIVIMNRNRSYDYPTLYTTSRKEILRLTDEELAYSNTPAFAEIPLGYLEHARITGDNFPNGEPGSYDVSDFVRVPWDYDGATYSKGSGLSSQSIFYVGVANEFVRNPMGGIIASSATINSVTHNSIDTKIGTPVYYSQNRPYCKLKSCYSKSGVLYEIDVFFDTKETISGVTYKPDYKRQKLIAGSGQGEYRPTAAISGNIEDTVTLRFYYDKRAGTTIIFTNWKNGSVDYKIYLDDEDEKLYIDKDNIFRWEVPSEFSSRQITWKEKLPEESEESPEEITFTVKDLYDEDSGITLIGIGFQTISYNNKTWEFKESTGSSSYSIPSTAYFPIEAHNDIVLTYYERIPITIQGEKEYVWTDEQGFRHTQKMKIDEETVYLIDVEKFV